MGSTIGYILLTIGIVLLLWLVLPFAVWIVKMGVIAAVALFAIYYGLKILASDRINPS